jgi:hypothetical protein
MVEREAVPLLEHTKYLADEDKFELVSIVSSTSLFSLYSFGKIV